ncbi:DUF808 domain-containing protein [Aestuariibacter salexigens]|uniref:DUF808 domain-containing protein n=1 Tax=Aestuariibacter salexigens TaxID=226010 RepID=UPI000404AD0C|nr:DUF808 domain-containing protein [Aestuariibacter salexigens]
MATSLLALLDDIATVMDDVAMISKVAAKETAGVLGDDIALNAQQVSGMSANRELPVVWAVAKGSAVNKLILVPSALLISAIYAPLITVLLVIGGLYLCFEGFEKVWHTLRTRKQDREEKDALRDALLDPELDLKTFEKEKIKGAIKTDFILSAEIIVIIMGSAAEQPLTQQIITLSWLSLAFTIGVYGLVAAIVKLDDVGLHLLKRDKDTSSGLGLYVGKALLVFAPFLMKSLTVVGTLAMFLVGGGILVHDTPLLHHLSETILGHTQSLPGLVNAVLPILLSFIAGLIAGAVVMLIISIPSALGINGKAQH